MKEVIIIGGGFFGLYLSEYLSIKGHRVTLIERENDFMQRASYVNQARVHNGYHYPRSILTALRSRISFPVFTDEFKGCIDSEFDKYYLIGKSLSKVTANQFKLFCDRIGAPCNYDSSFMNGILNKNLIEASFLTKEYAFDSMKLKNVMADRISASKVNVMLESEVVRVYASGNGTKLNAEILVDGCLESIECDHVFNCTYSGINLINNQSGLDLVPLKHEMTEMCLVEVPNEIKNKGITIMCGPFFSVMPFPSQNLHSFSHVRYTPHYEWEDKNDNFIDSYKKHVSDKRHTAWNHMVKDGARYIPLLNECDYKKSIWDVKTILPRSDTNDSRPILFLPNYSVRGYHCIMGGKIDNVYDVIKSIESKNLIG